VIADELGTDAMMAEGTVRIRCSFSAMTGCIHGETTVPWAIFIRSDNGS
jgi:hypothetical protein